MKPIKIENEQLEQINKIDTEAFTDTRLLEPGRDIYTYPVGEKKLWYIPRDSKGQLIQVIAPTIAVKGLEGTTAYFRDTTGIPANQIPGVSGKNPLREFDRNVKWEYANAFVVEHAYKQNVQPNQLAEDIKKAIRNKALGESQYMISTMSRDNDSRIVMPIVELQVKMQNGNFTPVIDLDNGRPTFKVYWYILGKAFYNSKFKQVEDNLQMMASMNPDSGMGNSIGGNFFAVDFPGSKNVAPNKRGDAKMKAAQHMAITLVPNVAQQFNSKEEYDKFRRALDASVNKEGYTAYNAVMTLRDFAFFPDSALQENIVDVIGKPLVDKINEVRQRYNIPDNVTLSELVSGKQ